MKTLLLKDIGNWQRKKNLLKTNPYFSYDVRKCHKRGAVRGWQTGFQKAGTFDAVP